MHSHRDADPSRKDMSIVALWSAETTLTCRKACIVLVFHSATRVSTFNITVDPHDQWFSDSAWVFAIKGTCTIWSTCVDNGIIYLLINLNDYVNSIRENSQSWSKMVIKKDVAAAWLDNEIAFAGVSVLFRSRCYWKVCVVEVKSCSFKFICSF